MSRFTTGSTTPIGCKWIAAIITFIALATFYNFKFHRMVVETAFLNGGLEEEVYMEQLEGIIMPSQEHEFYTLVKSRYRLKTSTTIKAQKFR